MAELKEAWKSLFANINKKRKAESTPDEEKAPKTTKETKLPDISGLDLKEEFITKDEEMKLLEWINAQKWSTEKGREVQQHGYAYNYAYPFKTPEYIGPIPEQLMWLVKRVAPMFPREPEQIIINKYRPKQGITAHTDHQKHFGKVIASLSLQAHGTMVMTKLPQIHNILLNRRSLIVMKNEARYKWLHSITNELEKDVRISITFRTMNVNDIKASVQKPV